MLCDNNNNNITTAIFSDIDGIWMICGWWRLRKKYVQFSVQWFNACFYLLSLVTHTRQQESGLRNAEADNICGWQSLCRIEEKKERTQDWYFIDIDHTGGDWRVECVMVDRFGTHRFVAQHAWSFCVFVRWMTDWRWCLKKAISKTFYRFESHIMRERVRIQFAEIYVGCLFSVHHYQWKFRKKKT